MKDADKRARQRVALGGLILLLHNYREDKEHSISRKYLVALPKGEEDDPALMKAVRSRSWLREYVKRLVDAGILTHLTADGQDSYQPANVRKLEALIHDHEEPSYGLRMSQFLFPSEAGLPVELRSGTRDALAEATGIEIPADVTDDEANEEEGEEEGTAKREMVIIKSVDMRSLLDGMRNLEALVEVLGEEATQERKEFMPQIRNRMKGMDDRLAAMEKAVENQYTSSARASQTLTRIDATITGVTAGMSAVGAKVDKINPTTIAAAVSNAVREALGFGLDEGSPTLSEVLRTALDKFQSQSNLRETLAELRAKLKDLDAVEELALRAIEESEGS